MTMLFKYERENEKSIFSPLIKVLVNDKLETFALLDSGSDISVIPKYVADSLGLNLSSELKLGFGIGGEVNSIASKVKIKIENGGELHEFNIPIKVVLSDHIFPVLLGRKGFFDKFIICFNESQEQLSLTKVAG